MLICLSVVDASYENHDFHIEVTNKVLEEIGAGDKEKIIAFNKIDLLEEQSSVIPVAGAENVFISAKYDRNIDRLIELIKNKIFSDMVRVQMVIPYTRGDISSYLCERSRVLAVEYKENGTWFDAELKAADYQRFKEYEVI